MKEKRPTLCIVAGPNGSGKTTTMNMITETGAFLCF